MCEEPIATAKLAALANQKGAATEVDRLLSYVVPPTTAPSPRKMAKNDSTRCSTCGRDAGEVDYFMSGSSAVICNHCVIQIGQHRRTLTAPEHASCSLCGASAFEVRGMYSYNGIEICSGCLDLSGAAGARRGRPLPRGVVTYPS